MSNEELRIVRSERNIQFTGEALDRALTELETASCRVTRLLDMLEAARKDHARLLDDA